MKRQRGGDGNRENKPGYQLEMLRSKAQGADQAGNKDAAVKLWQQVLQIEPRDYQASRAGEGDAFCSANSQLPVYLTDLPHALLHCARSVGMALSYKDEFEKAMPYLDVALGHRPNDYTLNHYAGINQKLRSDRLPDTEQSLKQELWEAAIVYCETARRHFPSRAPGRDPSWNDRFFFIHWCFAHDDSVSVLLSWPNLKHICCG